MSAETIDLAGRVFDYEKEKWEPTYEWNSELAHQILDIIRANPKLWDQKSWAVAKATPTEEEAGDLAVNQQSAEMCGTAMCFAGWAVELEVGLDWEFSDEWRQLIGAPVGSGFTDIFGDVTPVQNWHDTGGSLLGLKREEARLFFTGSNTLWMLEKMVELKDQGLSLTINRYESIQDADPQPL